MQDRREAWKDYKKDVLARISDFTWLFGSLKQQKPSGDGWFVARCPFHADQNPSFAFNRKSGRWACFSGCGKGSALDFLMHTSGSSFKDALLALGDKVGLARPHLNGTSPSSGDELTESHVSKFQDALAANEKILRYLKERRGLTQETISRFELGWDAARKRIAIPIRDEKRQLVNIRLYSPSLKPKMINLKGHGNTPRLYGIHDLADYKGSQIVICEGEFDCLLLRQNGFCALTSTHGCASFRKEWLPFFEGKDIVIGYDMDAEGQAAVKKIVMPILKDAKLCSIKNLALPVANTKQDKDFTDLFTKPRSVSGDLFEKRCFTGADLQALIDKTLTIDRREACTTQDHAALLQAINSIRESQGLKAHQKFISVAESLADHLSTAGAFFFDPKASGEYLCLEGRLYTISNNRAFNALLQRLGRFNITTQEGKFVWEFLRNHARERGSPVWSVGWVYGDPVKQAIYIHTHDDQGRILKIAANEITLMPNGQNPDKILLNPSDRVQPLEYLEGGDTQAAWTLFKRLLTEAFPCAASDQAILSCSVPLIFLKDFCPAKPIFRLSGSSDSGKTTAAKLIGYLVYGEDIAKTGTIASFYTDASRNPLAMLDNLEVANMKGELLDFLLTGATGIVHEKKKLYTDQEIVREKANSFIMTTGIESLGKPELLSRQWDINCDASFHRQGFSQNLTISKIVSHRNEILSAVFKLLAFEVLPSLGKRYEVDGLLRREFKDHPKDRTFECLSLALLIWDALEGVLGFERDLWAQWVRAQQIEAEETMSESNVVVQFLSLFKGAIRAFEGAFSAQAKDMFMEKFQILPETSDEGAFFEASAGELLQIFTTLAKQYGYPRPFENAKQLMARLHEAMPMLRTAGWQIELQVRKSHGERIHRLHLPQVAGKQVVFGGIGA